MALLRTLQRRQIIKAINPTTLDHLRDTSFRFRRFIDAQLQLLAQAGSQECEYLYSALALNIPRLGNFSIRGGAPALAEKLADSIKSSGGRIRFDTTALRLAYDATGRLLGLTSERGEVERIEAIVSIHSVDTYGKLIGHHTPLNSQSLNNLRGWGVYLPLGMIENCRVPDSQQHICHSRIGSMMPLLPKSLSQFAAAPAMDRMITGRVPA